MSTIPFTDLRWCPECGENVRVQGTEVVSKNASDKVVVRSKEGRDDHGHLFTY